jgi:hypothetical protein
MLANIRLVQGRLSSVHLLVKMARFVKKKKKELIGTI